MKIIKFNTHHEMILHFEVDRALVDEVIDEIGREVSFEENIT